MGVNLRDMKFRIMNLVCLNLEDNIRFDIKNLVGANLRDMRLRIKNLVDVNLRDMRLMLRVGGFPI